MISSSVPRPAAHFLRNIPAINAVYAIAILGHLVVIWLPSYPPLFDFPNHMVRHYLESLALRGDPLPYGLSIEYGFLPNLGGDLVVPLLLQIFPLIAAGKIFLTLSVALFGVGATLLISQQHGYSRQGSWAAVFILPWLLNSDFFLGFINYYSGVGLALIATWNYIRLYQNKRRTRLAIGVHTVLVTGLFFWHLTAIGLYGILKLCHFLSAVVQHRRSVSAFLLRMAPLLLSALPALLLLGYLLLFSRDNAMVGSVSYMSLTEKLYNLVIFMFWGYHRAVNISVSLVWLLAIGVSFSPRIKNFLRWNWLYSACGVLAAVYLLLPWKMGTTAFLDVRILPVLLVCGVSLLGVLPFRMPRFGLWLVAASMIVRLFSIGCAWKELSYDSQEYTQALRSLPIGSSVLVNNAGCKITPKNPGHVAAWAVPERGLIISSLFAIPGQQPLKNVFRRHDFDDPALIDGENHYEIDDRLLGTQFEYFWFCNQTKKEFIPPPDWTLAFRYKYISLWTIPPPRQKSP